MSPTLLFPPATESTDQLTPVPPALLRVAVTCCVAPGEMQGFNGAMVRLPVGVGGGVGWGEVPAATRYWEHPTARKRHADPTQGE